MPELLLFVARLGCASLYSGRMTRRRNWQLLIIRKDSMAEVFLFTGCRFMKVDHFLRYYADYPAEWRMPGIRLNLFAGSWGT